MKLICYFALIVCILFFVPKEIDNMLAVIIAYCFMISTIKE